MIAWFERQFVARTGSRTQPPTPINNALTGLLDRVKNTKDPWLLFLCAIIQMLTVIWPNQQRTEKHYSSLDFRDVRKPLRLAFSQ